MLKEASYTRPSCWHLEPGVVCVLLLQSGVVTEIDSTGAFDFDAAVDRLGTDSIKWSGLEAGALAMHLADMDLRTAPVVIDALRDRVEHGAFGYGQATAAFTEAIEGWLK